MQSVSSRIWTRITVSISYDDNHYTTGTPILFNRSTMINYLSARMVMSVLFLEDYYRNSFSTSGENIKFDHP